MSLTDFEVIKRLGNQYSLGGPNSHVFRRRSLLFGVSRQEALGRQNLRLEESENGESQRQRKGERTE